jgi:hypothetical protein
MANECQFTFYVQSFLVPQKLRGTTTYMVKVTGGGVRESGRGLWKVLFFSLNQVQQEIKWISESIFRVQPSSVQSPAPSKCKLEPDVGVLGFYPFMWCLLQGPILKLTERRLSV